MTDSTDAILGAAVGIAALGVTAGIASKMIGKSNLKVKKSKELKCPGSKIRSKGLGRGLGRGKKLGPIGVPFKSKW